MKPRALHSTTATQTHHKGPVKPSNIQSPFAHVNNQVRHQISEVIIFFLAFGRPPPHQPLVRDQRSATPLLQLECVLQDNFYSSYSTCCSNMVALPVPVP